MKDISPEQICFGLNEELDRSSFSRYLQLAGQPEVAQTLAQRMNSEEIETFVSHFSGLLKAHFSDNEYHQLFLQQTRK